MKEFGNKIRLIPLADIIDVKPTRISLSREDRILTIYLNKDLTFSSSTQNTDAGTLYTYNISALVSKNEQLKQYRTIPLVLELVITSSSEGEDRTSVRYLGNKTIPVRLLMQEQVNSINISTNISTPTPFLL